MKTNSGPTKTEGKATSVSGQDRLVHGEFVAGNDSAVPEGRHDGS